MPALPRLKSGEFSNIEIQWVKMNCKDAVVN
ncbi:hypothetical protein F9Z35_1390 [Neisseria gonorrhoeae]|nr:hypothetical protein F9Z35_1390 [Neisseria gonorrhoeae]